LSISAGPFRHAILTPRPMGFRVFKCLFLQVIVTGL
jgi:hypothetical protein